MMNNTWSKFPLSLSHLMNSSLNSSFIMLELIFWKGIHWEACRLLNKVSLKETNL